MPASTTRQLRTYAALARALEAEPEEVEPTCDICGLSQNFFGDGDWNGDMGHHYSCEEAQDDGGPTRGDCHNPSCACNAPMYVPKPEDKVDVRKFVEENAL